RARGTDAPGARPRLRRAVARGARRAAARHLRAEARAGDALPRHHERGHRTGQILRWHRRPQVRQRRAGQAGEDTAAARISRKTITRDVISAITGMMPDYVK